MNIHGMGIVSARGIGVESFENALKEGWRAPEEVAAPYSENRKGFAYQVDLANIPDKAVLKNMRRADKLSKMAVVAASEALKNSGIEGITDRSKIGVIIATALGAHVTTFNLLDDILEYGEANVSPTTFSNSVHNAAASYISSALCIEGPTLTITQFFFSFQSALQLAQAWLDEKRCEHILVGAVEQYGEVLAYIHDTKLNSAPDGRIRPFSFNPAFQVPGEGAVFFLVSNNKSGHRYCEIQSVATHFDGDNAARADLNIFDADGLLSDESAYLRDQTPEIPVAAYSPIFGSMMSGSAFNCAAGALMLSKQMLYASPIIDNPHGLNIVNNTAPSNIELIRCVRYNCFNQKGVIQLRAALP